MDVTNPLHPVHVVGQAERFLLAHLPIVILSTRTAHGRDRRPSPTRALPPAPTDAPTWTGADWPGVSGLAGGPCYGGAPPRARDRILDVDAVEVR